ncbi:hypothetical protein [Rhizobium sp. P44RR-XXIV]|uniref:hypothetical protein n=1 Tax=Rhizobium sp. P44RR-XXIV TaxID=1921145 RepID=UPI0010AA00A0|nr:hypothetical protein [Rhizobium sp. P44RR-XXIV]TIX89174.1 hypothetical protein BSK43_021450 [Rhizobium sp. P44RR-XXIV]
MTDNSSSASLFPSADTVNKFSTIAQLSIGLAQSAYGRQIWAGYNAVPTRYLPNVQSSLPRINRQIEEGAFAAIAAGTRSVRIGSLATVADRIGVAARPFGGALMLGENTYDLAKYQGPSRVTRAVGIAVDDAVGVVAGIATVAAFGVVFGTPPGWVALGVGAAGAAAYGWWEGDNVRNGVTGFLDKPVSSVMMTPMPNVDLSRYYMAVDGPSAPFPGKLAMTSASVRPPLLGGLGPVTRQAMAVPDLTELMAVLTEAGMKAAVRGQHNLWVRGLIAVLLASSTMHPKLTMTVARPIATRTRIRTPIRREFIRRRLVLAWGSLAILDRP